jgi:hypothetical protein
MCQSCNQKFSIENLSFGVERFDIEEEIYPSVHKGFCSNRRGREGLMAGFPFFLLFIILGLNIKRERLRNTQIKGERTWAGGFPSSFS